MKCAPLTVNTLRECCPRPAPAIITLSTRPIARGAEQLSMTLSPSCLVLAALLGCIGPTALISLYFICAEVIKTYTHNQQSAEVGLLRVVLS